MGRIPKPWFWDERGKWFVTIDGTRHDLGPDEEEAHRKYHRLMAARGEIVTGKVRLQSVVAAYLAYLERTAKPETCRVARWSLEPLPDLDVKRLSFEAVEGWMKANWRPSIGPRSERLLRAIRFGA